MSRRTLRDRIWIRRSFLLSKEALTDADIAQRAMTTASLKFTDTTMGGNFCVNPAPQFTRFADINASKGTSAVWAPSFGGFLGYDPSIGDDRARRTNSRGMGRYYSETIDDNGQIVTMRFGVPQYNSFVGFFGNFYDPSASMMARTGRAQGLIFDSFKLVGLTLALPWQPFVLMGRIYKRMRNLPASKFYYLKPTMPLYWNAVSTIVNGIGLNMGITPKALTPGQANVMDLESNRFSEGELKNYHSLMPDIIGEDGLIDVRGISSRAQRLANQYNRYVRGKLDRHAAQWNNQENNERTLQSIMAEIQEQTMNNAGLLKDPGASRLDDYVKAFLEIDDNKPKTRDGKTDNDAVEMIDSEVSETVDEATGKSVKQISRSQYGMKGGESSEYDGAHEPGRWDKVVRWGKSFWEFAGAEARDGSDWVSFRVDYNPTQSESFSNSTRPHDLASQMNSTSQQARMTRINFAEGNVGDGLIANTIEKAVSLAKSAVTGIAAGVQLSGLAALAGNALVDIPNVWDSSTANLPRIDCSMQLRSVYGNRLALLRNIWVPVACLLAGTLPISHGVHAHGSPFLVEAYMQGRAAIRLGVIDQLSITRGTGNFGWNYDREALGVDVSFSIVDMSSVMHMPITANMGTFGTNAVMAAGQAVDFLTNSDAGTNAASMVAPGTYDEDSSFTDYLGVCGSLALPDMVYPTQRWHLNRVRTIRNWKDQLSPARAAQGFMYGTVPGQILNALARPTDRFR